MSIGRRILLWACAVIVPVSLVTIVGVGSAAATKGPSFSGAAVGTVTCIGVNVKLSFSPPAKLSSGGNSATIKGKFSGCHVTNTPAGRVRIGNLGGEKPLWLPHLQGCRLSTHRLLRVSGKACGGSRPYRSPVPLTTNAPQ